MPAISGAGAFSRYSSTSPSSVLNDPSSGPRARSESNCDFTSIRPIGVWMLDHADLTPHTRRASSALPFRPASAMPQICYAQSSMSPRSTSSRPGSISPLPLPPAASWGTIGSSPSPRGLTSSVPSHLTPSWLPAGMRPQAPARVVRPKARRANGHQSAISTVQGLRMANVGWDECSSSGHSGHSSHSSHSSNGSLAPRPAAAPTTLPTWRLQGALPSPRVPSNAFLPSPESLDFYTKDEQLLDDYVRDTIEKEYVRGQRHSFKPIAE